MTTEEIKLKVRRALLTAPPSGAEGIVRQIAGELAHEIDFAEISSLAESLIGGTILPRASMYTEATYSTFENNVLARETDEGVTLGRRVLEEGDNCDDCIAASTEEFVPLDELPEIGDSVCGSRCRCEFEFGDESSSFKTSELFSGTIGGQEAFGGDVEIN